jgi:hypothetical protein
MKMCNGGYCNYKLLNGSNPSCSYQGYCDYQCPKDSREYGVKPTMTLQGLYVQQKLSPKGKND